MSQTNRKRHNRNVYTEKELIEGLQNSENWVFNELYRTQFPVIKSMVFKYKNKLIDPKDVFQEGLTRLIDQIKKGKLIIKKSVAALLFIICKRYCIEIFKKNDKFPILRKQDFNLDVPDYKNEEDDDNYYLKLELMKKIKNQIKKECREIIDIRFKLNDPNFKDKITLTKLTKHDEIAQKLGMTADNVRKSFTRCMDQLRKLIYNNPEYKTLTEKTNERY